jgi:hypothetical protein
MGGPGAEQAVVGRCERVGAAVHGHVDAQGNDGRQAVRRGRRQQPSLLELGGESPPAGSNVTYSRPANPSSESFPGSWRARDAVRSYSKVRPRSTRLPSPEPHALLMSTVDEVTTEGAEHRDQLGAIVLPDESSRIRHESWSSGRYARLAPPEGCVGRRRRRRSGSGSGWPSATGPRPVIAGPERRESRHAERPGRRESCPLWILIKLEGHAALAWGVPARPEGAGAAASAERFARTARLQRPGGSGPRREGAAAFGWLETPRVVDGRVAVLLHLPSRAGCPVAVTRDLASFGRAGYQQVRAELRSRCLRHPWPMTR